MYVSNLKFAVLKQQWLKFEPFAPSTVQMIRIRETSTPCGAELSLPQRPIVELW